ncbi:hypothetical protein QVD99_006668 [Batrachochytrium dendrobatidis]|uniref:TLC domain-containing protein n=1 Tax=Batrachochytrium dendrobatidis (strain JEL423) TaxID=403673 RepID=A0A177WME2_BATDL|nr:hypothetical protein QVD99_006668 [Batrachochytrium dendrobatidis]OAJ41263.1 hypothetical protein BDEG_24896 [Batrachochytrium dendrobatidis JEL423]
MNSSNTKDMLSWSFNTVLGDIGLQRLETHGWHVLSTTVVTQIVFMLGCYFSAPISHYAKLSPSKKASWGMHIVSMIFSLLICTIAVPVFFTPELAADKLFGYSFYAGVVYSIACGYFLWDIAVSIFYIQETGLGFVIHAVACFSVFMLSFRPFLYYYGSVFLMFEASTIFLNVHWFCDKTGLTGSLFQWVNGIILLGSFFSVRIVFGIYQSVLFFVTCIQRWDEVPTHLFVVYAIANILLCSLNVFWFTRMIKSVVSRFKGGSNAQEDDGYGKLNKKAKTNTAGATKKHD